MLEIDNINTQFDRRRRSSVVADGCGRGGVNNPDLLVLLIFVVDFVSVQNVCMEDVFMDV
jgi:hypothetical protein